jgi:hypothetical protein
MQPSSEVASLSVTCGRPWPAASDSLRGCAETGQSASSAAIPAADARHARPCRARIGSAQPTTTRASPDAATRSAQAGPRAETWAQGSSVTYMVAPRASPPSAIASA